MQFAGVVQLTPAHPAEQRPQSNAASKLASQVHTAALALVGLTPHRPRSEHGADDDGPGHATEQFAPMNPGRHAVQLVAASHPGRHTQVPRSEHSAPAAPRQVVATVHDTLHVAPYHPAAQSRHVAPPYGESHTHSPVVGLHAPCAPHALGHATHEGPQNPCAHVWHTAPS